MKLPVSFLMDGDPVIGHRGPFTLDATYTLTRGEEWLGGDESGVCQ